MPRPRKFESNAFSQSAYSRRKPDALSGLPGPVSLAVMPSTARWKPLLSKVERLRKDGFRNVLRNEEDRHAASA